MVSVETDGSLQVPEFWGYFPSYDWVLLCQLFGPMVDLPACFPHRPNDIAQLMRWFRVPKSVLPAMPTTHNALDNARWNRDALKTILKLVRTIGE